MVVLQMLGLIVRFVARTVHALTVCGVVSTQFLGRRVASARQRGAGGEPGMVRLLDLHAASCAGDTLVAIGLAGTIFFAVPAGEARGRVALYLLVTMLPFALLAPVVGPVLDRFRHGRRYALATTMLGRAFLAYLISEHLGGLALYPAAFGVLVLSRAYGVARSAAVPRVLPPTLGLSEAGARASVFGTVAGAVAAPIGLGAAAIGPEWSLRASTVVFVFGMITALRLPPRADSDPPEAVPRPLQRPGHRGAKILSGRIVIASLIGSGSLRLLYGFLMLYLAFAIRSESLPADVLGRDVGQGAALGLVAGALGLGSLLATAVGTKLRIHRPAQLQAGGLVLVAGAGVAAAALPGLPLITLLCLTTAVASGLAKLAVDAVIQERVEERVRASAFAHSETLLMTAWVAGGALGLVAFPVRWGAAIAAGFALAAAVWALRAAVVLRGERLHGSPITDTVMTPPVTPPAATSQAEAAEAAEPAEAAGASQPPRQGSAARSTRRVPAPAGRPTQRKRSKAGGATPEPADAAAASSPTPADATATTPADATATDQPGQRPRGGRWLSRRFGRRRAPADEPAGQPRPATQQRSGAQPQPAAASGTAVTAAPADATTDAIPAARQAPRAAVARDAKARSTDGVPDWDATAADTDDSPLSPPGFHLYRPSGLTPDDDDDGGGR